MHAFTQSLAAEYAGLVRAERVGRSSRGEPIWELRIGSGPKPVLVVGNPHPNEPIGLATIQHLARRLCADPGLCERLGVTWHFVPCVDPDGTRLNEGWFAGPFTREHVARNFYRPPVDAQPEWTFPAVWQGKTAGSPIPETRTLMRLIDRIRPALIASLHNGDFGGAFYYLSDGDREYWTALTDLLTEAGIPLDVGQPDAPGARVFAPGVFELPSFGVICDTLAAAGADPADLVPGGSTRDYSGRYGSAILISELPLWVDHRVADPSPISRTFQEVLHASAARYRADKLLFDGVLARLGNLLSGTSPFQRAILSSARITGAVARAKAVLADAPDSARPATAAEVFMEEEVWPSVFRLRAGGMLLRLFDDEKRAGNDAPVLEAERARFAPIFDDWCAEVAVRAPGQPVPLHRLVGVQAAAIAIAVTRVRDGLPR
ncbi:M14 family zinc carboxypeptidase [Amycolatopsis anabasis]|uniref:M14 family zinc carboxypeptidase n=1 Tax=Amycolatopsis anabasis TaxID=1840409 RepID=UPI00131BA378|nr:M14 family zinc carboxypeptidase [Amycolatopsis anabasis]